MPRQALIDAFLGRAGWQSAERQALTQDASFRRYWRLTKDTQTAMLMDAPPPEKPVSLFASIARFLREHALYAPEILAIDEKNSLLLLQDFGDATFTRILSRNAREETQLYELAIDTLATLHRIDSYAAAALAPYDSQTMKQEASLLTDWFYPAITRKPITPQQCTQFSDAWHQCLDALPPHPSVLVLRDYHVDNLMRVVGENKQVHCGLLDFQDALMGSPAYDLISLLEDARRDVPAALKTHCLERYFDTMQRHHGFTDRATIEPWMNVLAAQRHAKVLGIFVRLYKRDNKAHYLKHLPRVLGLFEDAIKREPRLKPIADWVTEHMPLSNINLTSLTQHHA